MANIKVDGFKTSDLMAQVASNFDSYSQYERKARMKTANAIFELQVKNKAGKEETWTIDLKKEGKVYHGKAKPKADITIIISDDHLIELAYGSLDGHKAYLTGKLKTKGNILLATRLKPVLGTPASKASI